MAAKVGTSTNDKGYKASATPALAGVTAGNALYCYITGWVGTTPATAVSFSDDKGNTWAQAGFQSSLTRYAAIGYCENVVTGGTVTVTATPTGGTGTVYVSAFVSEYSGMQTSGSLDKVAGTTYNGGATTTLDTTAAATTTQADELFVAVFGPVSASDSSVTDADAAGAAPSTGWTTEATGGDFSDAKTFVVSVLTSATAAAQSVITVSVGGTQYGCVIATFKQAAAGPAVTVTWVGYIG